MTENPVWATSD